jgi:predicted RND superfamily exporter protein
VIPLSRAAIRHPLRTLAIALLTTLAAAPGLLRLELRTDGQALVPRQAPAVVYDRRIREEFGALDPIAVVIRTSHPGGVFNPGTLRRVRDLTAALERLPGVRPADLLSLATEHTFRFRPNSFKLRTFLEPLPETPEQVAEAREDLRRIGLYDGVLVSADGQATAVMLGTPADLDRRRFYREVREVAAGFARDGDTVATLGAPVAEALLGSHILADLGLPPALLDGVAGVVGRQGPGLIPLVFAVMALVFLAAFRHPMAALTPLATLGACLVTTFGLMGWLGVPVYLTTTILPVILTAVGVTDQVHVYHRYAELRSRRPDLDAAGLARATMEEMAWPVTQTWVTTAVGFLSFAISPLPAVKWFGLFAAAGILVCLSWSLCVVPALLVLLRPALGRSRRPEGKLESAYARLARWALRRRRWVLAGAVLLMLVSLDGIRRLTVQDSWVDGFAPGSGFAKAMRGFDRQFLGAQQLLVTVAAEPLSLRSVIPGDAVGEHSLTLAGARLPAGFDPARLVASWVRVTPGPSPYRPALRDWSGSVESARREGDRLILRLPLKGGSPRFWLQPRPDERLDVEIRREPFMNPELLRQEGELEAFLAAQPRVGGVFGPAKFLATTAFMLAPDAPGSRRLPERPEQARSLWELYGSVRGPERLRQLSDPAFSRVVLTAFLKEPDYATTGRLMDDLRTYERKRLAPHGLRLGFAGDIAVSQALIQAIVTTQVGSLALSLAGIFALTAFLGRSLRHGLLCIVPAGLAVLLNFAVMGWLHIPLGVATSMFAGMTLGVGVDYVVHLLDRHRRARAAGLNAEEAAAEALAATGPPVTIDTLGVGLSFSVLLLSQVPANARLGGLLAFSLFVCLAATLLVVPALLTHDNRSAPPRLRFLHRDASRSTATENALPQRKPELR